MSFKTTISLPRILLSPAWSLLRDAVGDLFGHSLRYKASDFVTPENLTAQLKRHSVVQYDPNVEIRSVRVREQQPQSSNCCIQIIDINADEAASELSLYIKLPMPQLATRWFMNVINSWELETYFCKHVADSVPLRTPTTYAAQQQGTRFFLIQENLQADPQIKLFTNPDMMAGAPLELAYRCAAALAELHSAHYGLDWSQRDAILPHRYHPFTGEQMRSVSQAMIQHALKPCMIIAGDRIPAAVVQAFEKTMANWSILLEHWFSGPQSLVHGDSHLGNFFVNGDTMGMLDFQAVHWGRGTRDLQYFLIYSLPADVLAANEQKIIEHYVAHRSAFGAPITVEDCWQEYRCLSFHALMTMVVSIGFSALNEEHNELMLEMLDRAVAAIIRVDYIAWLDGHLESVA